MTESAIQSIERFEVRNFRGLKHIRIDDLGLVNLIVGKNNAGKSTLLEAIQMFATGGAPSSLWDLLSRREELQNDRSSNATELQNPADSPLLSLFFGRPKLWDSTATLSIETNTGAIRAAVEWFTEDRSEESPGGLIPIRRPPDANDVPAFVVTGTTPNSRHFLRLDRNLQRYKLRTATPEPRESCVYVGAGGLSSDVFGLLWDKIVLTDVEEQLTGSIAFLAPGVERISLVQSNRGDRTAKAKVMGVQGAIPLRSFGDGANRALGLLLAVSASREGGIVLIDEIENGIHYSAMEQLWQSLIDVAQRFGVQIFAATHSSDCIRAFQRATAAVPGHTGTLIKLEQRKGTISAVAFDEDELSIATAEHIEVR